MGISGVGKVGWTWDDLRVPTAYELLEGGWGRGVWSVSRWGPIYKFCNESSWDREGTAGILGHKVLTLP